MLDPQILRAFVEVAEHAGFTRAAEVLNLTQSTVSAQIRRLEAEVGQLLFVRTTRSVRLTSAGETLLGYARTILRLHEDARLKLSGARPMGRLRVGVAEDLVEQWLPEVLAAFAGRHPDVRVELEIGIGTRLLEMLEGGALDIVVGGQCLGPQGRRAWSEPLVWAFSAAKDVPEVVPLALFPEPCPYRQAALRALAGASRRWRVACTSSSLAGVRAAAAAGLGVTPLPLHALGPDLRVLPPSESLPRLSFVEYRIQTRDEAPQPAVAALETLILELAASPA